MEPCMAQTVPTIESQHVLKEVTLILLQVKRHGLQPRWGHCMASFSRGPDLEEVVIFGGSTKNSNEWNMDVEDPFIGSTTLLWFGM